MISLCLALLKIDSRREGESREIIEEAVAIT